MHESVIFDVNLQSFIAAVTIHLFSDEAQPSLGAPEIRLRLIVKTGYIDCEPGD